MLISVDLIALKKFIFRICNGNRTEWSPIRCVIIRVINKIGRPHSGRPICLITSMMTDRIGRHEVLLPINHNLNKICDIIGYFRPVTRILCGGGANEAKVDQTTEMYFLFSDPFI